MRLSLEREGFTIFVETNKYRNNIPLSGEVSKQFPAVYTPTRSHVVSVAGKITREEALQEGDTRQTGKGNDPLSHLFRSFVPLPSVSFLFFFFFPPDLFSAIAIMAHRDSHARRRWQIRKERPFKLECDPWDGPPSTVINMQSKALRSIPAKETRRVGLYPVTVPSKKRVTRMTVVSWKSIINGEFIRRIQENAVCGYPIFDRCGLF